jgi:hypothetical protein
MDDPYVKQNLPPLVRGPLSTAAWNDARREELLELLRTEEYGRIPEPASLEVSFRIAHTQGGFMDGRAVRKLVEITVRRRDQILIYPLYLFLPRGAEKSPAPVILFLSSLTINESDPSRRVLHPFWPAELMIARGYGAALLFTHDIAPDFEEGFSTKFHRLYPEYGGQRPPDGWGSVSAWAWGISRAVDYLVKDPAVKGEEIALAGFSRAGKTVLWCAAQDLRAGMVFAMGSGCSGAAITRGKTGEHIEYETAAFPFWFCPKLREYSGREEAMPFDQHMLLALIAPRPLYLSWKSFDSWADPRSEFEALREAGEVYRLYGKTQGLGEPMLLPEETRIAGNLGCHLRSGAHALDEYDWERYLNFADRHFHPAHNTG